MTKGDLWNLDSISVSIKDTKTAYIAYKRNESYSYNGKILDVNLGFIDTILGRSIADKVMRKLKSLTIKLERENEKMLELIKWQEGFENKQK